LVFERGGDILDYGRVIVIVGFAGTKGLETGVDFRRRGRDHFVACCSSELNYIVAYTCGTAPYEKGLF
jgi:hypothetical protein